MGRSRDRSYSRSRSRSGSLSSTSSGRTAKARNWNGEGGYRLHLSDLAMSVSRREVEKLFRSYGPLNEVWVASNPPCFAFINFCHRTDGERALKELDGTVVGGSRIGLSWARARTFRRRPHNTSFNHSPSPPYRRSYRDSYSSRRSNDRYSRRHYSRSRSRSPGYRRSGGHYRRRSPSSESRSRSRSRTRSPRDKRPEKHSKTSRRDDEHRRHRHRSESSSNSDSSDNGSSNRENGKQISRSPNIENHQATSSNGNNHHLDDINDHHADIVLNGQN